MRGGVMEAQWLIQAVSLKNHDYWSSKSWGGEVEGGQAVMDSEREGKRGGGDGERHIVQ